MSAYSALPWSWLMIVFFLTTVGVSCEKDPASALQGQNNAQLTFFGLAVDQDGNPLQDVSFEIVLDAIPKDWSFDNRGKPHDRTRQTVTSGADGRFSANVTAHMIFVDNAQLPGYRHLFAKWSDDGNTGYQITAWGEILYKSDPDRPAVYVFVKDGVSDVSALPSRGGFRAYGNQWIPNQPMWPKNPSLKDVQQKQPSSQSTTAPQ